MKQYKKAKIELITKTDFAWDLYLKSFLEKPILREKKKEKTKGLNDWVISVLFVLTVIIILIFFALWKLSA